MAETKLLPIGKICANTGQIPGVKANPRSIKNEKYDKLKKSLQDNPEMLDLRELLVYEHEGKYICIGGNMRYRACKELGLKEVPCKVIPPTATPEQLNAYIIKDNSGFGEWDWDMLANEWDEDLLDDWGVDFPHDDGVPLEEEEDAKEDDFDEEEDEVETRCKKGDIWQCGVHRLMCGDSTDAASVSLLMNGERADITFTSPPYNAGCTPTELKMNKTSKYKNDNDNKSTKDYTEFLCKYIENSLQYSIYSFCNIQSLANNKISIIELMYHFKDDFCDTLIWDKQNGQPAMAENVLNSVFEYIHVFSKVNSSRSVGTIKFRGTIDNIVRITKQNRNEYSKVHNATFPIELAAFFVKNFCKTNNITFDPFGGSGTTMIACEQLGRKCFMMELDPHYCDVILARWEKLTGKEAIKLN